MHALLNPTRVQSVSYDDADLFGLKPFNYQRTLLTTDRMRRRPNLPNLRYGCLLQKLQSIVPQSLDNLAGGFCPSQFGGLSSPHLHPLSVSSFARRFPHERGESALNRVGCWKRAIQRGTDVCSRDAAAESPAKCTRERRLVGFRTANSVCIGRMRHGFRRSQQACSHLDRTCTQDQGRSYSSCVRDPSRSDDRYVD